MPDYANVIPTTMNNLKAATRFRPVDFLNWIKLVKPLRDLSGGPRMEFDLYSLGFHMFTRLPFDFTPANPHAVGRPPAWVSRPAHRDLKVGLFADSPDHLSGVATTLGHWNRTARARGLEFRVHSSGDRPVIDGGALFPRMGSFRLHAYDGLVLHMPQVGDVLDYIRDSRPDVLHLSTPGPMGLIALLAARTLGIPLVSTFHTHFPSYVERLTGDRELTEVAWSFMRWFYGQMDVVASPTRSIREELIAHGLPADRIEVAGRGVDRDRFSPRRRDEALRLEWGPREPVRLIYVGRLSKEKNLDCLADAYRLALASQPELQLVLVGDGPYREDLTARLADTPAVFAGVRGGEDLARHHASGDLFVFPSETDTLGNVVLEAQASGLPVIVSSGGGPKDCVQDGVTGFVLPRMTPEALAASLLTLAASRETLARMGAAARRHTLRFTHDAAFDAFWRLHTLAAQRPRARAAAV